jgi:prepilin-type N-terminal cleavage/methylation domain-containing protein
MKTPNCKISNGFTLVELLVSMIITTIIVTVLVTVTVTSLDIWNRNRSEVRASLQAKAMVDSMAADFESMVVRRGNNFEWLFAEFAPPSEGPNGNQSPSALNLIFFSAATDRYNGQVGEKDGSGNPVSGPGGQPVDKGGDISAVQYQLIYKDPISDQNNDKYKTFALYRKLVNPDVTFQSLLGKEELETAAVGVTGDGDVTDTDAVKNFVCENVYQYNLKFHLEVTTLGVSKQVSVSLEGSEEFSIKGNKLETTAATLTPDELATARLTAVEVSLSVLTDGALRQLRGRSFSDPDKLSDFIAENSYQYSKLIPVPNY